MPVGISQLLNWGSPWQTAAGTVLNTAVTQTISPQGTGPQDFNVATSYLYQAATLRVTATGIITTTATSTTATLFLAAGTVPTTLCTPVGLTTGTTVITGLQWRWESWHTIIAAGASTGNTISSFGNLTLFNSGAALPANPIALTATPGMSLPAPNSAGDTLAAVNTAVAMPIMLRATLAGANATIQCNRFLVEHLYA
jgi:hypothetical protein